MSAKTLSFFFFTILLRFIGNGMADSFYIPTDNKCAHKYNIKIIQNIKTKLKPGA